MPRLKLDLSDHAYRALGRRAGGLPADLAAASRLDAARAKALAANRALLDEF